MFESSIIDETVPTSAVIIDETVLSFILGTRFSCRVLIESSFEKNGATGCEIYISCNLREVMYVETYDIYAATHTYFHFSFHPPP